MVFPFFAIAPGVTNLMAAVTRSPPDRAVVEEGVVAGLDLEQALGRLLASGDPGQVAEVLESLNAGGDHYQQIGVGCLRSRKCVRQSGRHDGEIPFGNT
jgi:hypothetical protein